MSVIFFHWLKVFGRHLARGCGGSGDWPFRSFRKAITLAKLRADLRRFVCFVNNAAAERIVKADAILDCSGTYAQPNGLGDGGIPAPGEGAAQDRIYYGIPDLAGDDRERFAGPASLSLVQAIPGPPR